MLGPFHQGEGGADVALLWSEDCRQLRQGAQLQLGQAGPRREVYCSSQPALRCVERRLGCSAASRSNQRICRLRRFCQGSGGPKVMSEALDLRLACGVLLVERIGNLPVEAGREWPGQAVFDGLPDQVVREPQRARVVENRFEQAACLQRFEVIEAGLRVDSGGASKRVYVDGPSDQGGNLQQPLCVSGEVGHPLSQDVAHSRRYP